MYVVINKMRYSLVGGGKLLPAGNVLFFALQLTTRPWHHQARPPPPPPPPPPLNKGVSTASALRSLVSSRVLTKFSPTQAPGRYI